MSPIGRLPRRSAFAVLALVIALTAPIGIEARAVAGVHIATGVIGAPLAPCDPESGPPLGSRFAGIGFVYLGTGAFGMQTVDVGGSAGLARTFTRSYSSLDTRTTLLGPGWMHDFEVRVRGDGSRDLLFTQPSGAVERFKDGHVIDRTVGTNRGYRVLTWDSETFVISDGPTTWTFDSTGSLLKRDDGAGDWVEVSYKGGHPASSTGPDGPGLRFEVGGGDRLARVVDASDATSFAEYEFDSTGRLTRAAPSGQPARMYAYDAASQRITTISDDDGNILEAIEYDDRGRVIREQDARGLLDGEAVTLAYEDLPNGAQRTTVTYPPSTIEPSWHPLRIVTHDAEGKLLDLTLRPTSTETRIGRYGYDAENRRIVLQDPCASAPTPQGPRGILGFIWLLIQSLLGIS